MRELTQRSKLVDVGRLQLEASRGGSSAADAEDEQEETVQAYVQRLQQAEKSGREMHERVAVTQVNLRQEWADWLELLTQCARRLQAKADAGEATVARVLEGDPGTPATNVLEGVQDLVLSANAMRKRLRACEAKEAAFKLKLDTIKSKITTQTLVLKLGPVTGRERASAQSARAGPPTASPSLPKLPRSAAARA